MKNTPTAYSRLSEEEKEKRREACRKWAARNDRSKYHKEYDERRGTRLEYQKEQRKLKPDQYATYSREGYHRNKDKPYPCHEPNYKLWSSAKKRSIKDQLPFNIEPHDVVISPSCPVCDQPIAPIKNKSGGGNSSPSLDKIIPALGYVKGNIAVMCKECNRKKQNSSSEWLRKMADFIDSFVN